MKIKQLNIDTGPNRESGSSCMFAKRFIISQPGVALELAVRA